MNNIFQKYLDIIYQNGRIVNPYYTPTVIGTISEHIDGVLSNGPKSDLDLINEHLSNIISNILHQMPEKINSAIRGDESSDDDLKLVYLIGQLSALQQFISRASAKRIDSAFVPTLTDPDFKPIIDILSTGNELTYDDLSRLSGLSNDTVKDRMKFLRMVGIAEFRIINNSVYNFLTPTAIIALQN